LTTTQVECDCDECQCNSSHLLITGIFPAIIITAIITAITATVISAIITAVIMRLYFKVKSRRRNAVKCSSPLDHAETHENSPPNTTGPLYEEVELTDKDRSLKFSQNVAYQSTSKNIPT